MLLDALPALALAEREVRREVDTVGAHCNTMGQSQNNGLLRHHVLTLSPAVTIATVIFVHPLLPPSGITPPAVSPAASPAISPCAAITTRHTTSTSLWRRRLRVVVFLGRPRALVAALVRLHAARYGLGGHAGADLDVGLLDADARHDGAAAAAAEGGGEHPLSVGIGELVDGDYADTGLVVAAVAGAEADAPPCLLHG